MLYLFDSYMLEGGDVCESKIMKKKKFATQHGKQVENKVGEIGYCFGSKIFGADIVWKLS